MEVKVTELYGYVGRILRVDLSSGSITQMPTMDYADRFLGGRGIAAKICWDEVLPETNAFDPENRLVFATGPLAGLSGISASRWTVCGKSPAMVPERFSHSVGGGSWGAQLKLSGCDAVVVQGKSDKPVYILIDDGVAETRDASHLWGKTTVETRQALKEELGGTTGVLACGPAGENLVRFAILLADQDAACSSGFGAVMGSKKLKAIAVRGSSKASVADPERLEELAKYVGGLLCGSHFGGPIMLTDPPEPQIIPGQEFKIENCWGCVGPEACARITVRLPDGTEGKCQCNAYYFYCRATADYYGKQHNLVQFYATRLCDDYGLDANGIMSMNTWLAKCHEAGILNDQDTGIPLSKIGSLDYIETLVKSVSLRDGFGDTLAEGTERAADMVGKGASELITDYMSRDGANYHYDPRMFLVHGLLYAMAPRQPLNEIHEIGFPMYSWLAMYYWKLEGAFFTSDLFRRIAKRFWGSELAVDFSTYDGKALAAKMIQDREFAKESMVLCDFAWPIFTTASGDHMGDPSVESKILSAVIGRTIDEQELYRIGERVFNLQRAVLARDGHGRRETDTIPESFFTIPLDEDYAVLYNNPACLAPGKDGEVTSRKGAVVDRAEFERMKGEYYQLRGWDVTTGLQTRAKMEDLGLEDIAEGLERRGLIV
jgi:aldehyde:ferredoxin oxidoreductase